jgi:hypothetical protein
MSESTRKKWKSLKRKRKLEIDFDPDKLTQNHNANCNVNDLSEKENLCGTSSVSGTLNAISDDNDATSDTIISKYNHSENFSIDSSEENYSKSSCINDHVSNKLARSQCSKCNLVILIYFY